jgi:hypothetical protein
VPINYGKASAGGLTLSDPCNGVFDLGVSCGGGDFEAWWNELGKWVAFTHALDAEATKLGAPETWPSNVQLAGVAAAAATELYNDGFPWFQWEGHIGQWGEAQQDLRNYCGALATWMAAKGVAVPNGAPSDAPAKSSWTNVILGIAAIGGGAWVASQYVNRTGGRRGR